MWIKLSYIVDKSFDVLHVTDNTYDVPKTYVTDEKPQGFGGNAWGTGFYTTIKNKNTKGTEVEVGIEDSVNSRKQIREKILFFNEAIEKWKNSIKEHEEIIRHLINTRELTGISAYSFDVDKYTDVWEKEPYSELYKEYLQLDEINTNLSHDITRIFLAIKMAIDNPEYKEQLDKEYRVLYNKQQEVSDKFNDIYNLFQEIGTYLKGIEYNKKKIDEISQIIEEYSSNLPPKKNTNNKTDVTQGYLRINSNSIVRNQRVPVGTNVLDLEDVPQEVGKAILEFAQKNGDYTGNINEIPANFVELYKEILKSDGGIASSNNNYSEFVKNLGYDAIQYPAHTNVKSHYTNTDKPTKNFLIINDDIIHAKKFERKNLTK